MWKKTPENIMTCLEVTPYCASWVWWCLTNLNLTLQVKLGQGLVGCVYHATSLEIPYEDAWSTFSDAETDNRRSECKSMHKNNPCRSLNVWSVTRNSNFHLEIIYSKIIKRFYEITNCRDVILKIKWDHYWSLRWYFKVLCKKKL